MINEGKNDRYIFHAVVVIGGPGSGKSYIGKRLAGMFGLKVVNPDTITEWFIKTKNLPAGEVYSRYGEKTDALHKEQLAGYLDGRLGLLLDGTGRRREVVESIIASLREIGYLVMVLFVNTDVEVASERNSKRDRVVDDSFLRSAHKDVVSNLGYYFNLVDGKIVVLDNTDISDHRPFDHAVGYVRRFLQERVPDTPAVRAWWRS